MRLSRAALLLLLPLARAHQPLQATGDFGDGYQFWLFPLKERSFTLRGVHGQAVMVQPRSPGGRTD